MRIALACVIAASVWLSAASSLNASPIPAVGSAIGKALLKYFGKEAATDYLAKKGGQEILERVTKQAAKQGGDATVQRVAKLASKHGPEALEALDHSGNLLPVLKSLDQIPDAEIPAALARLSAGSSGRELAESIAKHGASALKSEIKHPGVGMLLVRALGDDGAELAAKLSSDQAIRIGRHADEIAVLPAAQRSGLLSIIKQDTDRMVAFAGRFVEKNPGKTLFTVATTTVILAEPERILGGDEITFDADGNPIVVSKTGVVGRTIEAGSEAAAHVSNEYLRPLYLTILAFVTTFASVWVIIKLWGSRSSKPAPATSSTEGEVGSES